MQIYWPTKIKLSDLDKINAFLNQMTKRLVVGQLRYGKPSADKQYIKRLKLELKAYQRSGNHEHLVNAANYALLESLAPSNKWYHFDPSVDSVTREKHL